MASSLAIHWLVHYNSNMAKPMKYRDLARLLTRAGFTARQGKGNHEVWSNGSVSVTITQSREVSPGLTRKALQAIERSRQ